MSAPIVRRPWAEYDEQQTQKKKRDNPRRYTNLNTKEMVCDIKFLFSVLDLA